MITPMLRLICQTSDFLVMLTGHIAALLMPVLASVVVFEVFSRYLLNAPTIWGYDTALFLFGYIAALGGAYAQQKRAHINVDILYLSVSTTSKRLFSLLTSTLGLVFLYIILIMAIEKYHESIEYDYRTQSEWAAPLWHFWVMIILASSLFIMQICRDMISNLFSLATDSYLLPEDEDTDRDDFDSSTDNAPQINNI